MRTIKRLLPSQEYLREALDYNLETGVLTWKHRPIHHFRSNSKFDAKHQQKWWNSRYGGKTAFGCLTGGRYYVGDIGGVSTLAHRVIWKMMRGEEPRDIDHIDGNGRNNSWSNLRSVNTSTNMKNMKVRENSVSGVKGVQHYGRTGKWRARIQDHRGKEIHLGVFENKQDAIDARKKAEIELGGYLSPSCNPVTREIVHCV